MRSDSSTSVLRLHRAWSYIVAREGVELRSFRSGERLFVRGDERLEHFFQPLVSGLAPNRALDQLVNNSGLDRQAVGRLLQNLLDRQVLLVSQPWIYQDDDSDQYVRQPLFFEIFEQEGITGSMLNERLQNHRVVIVGLGGVGSWIAALCARIGIRQIVGVDGDTVARSNLARQILYNEADIGQAKVKVTEQRVREIDPRIHFESAQFYLRRPEDLERVLPGADFVFATLSYASYELSDNIAIACTKQGVPFMTLGGWGTIGPICIPGQTACHRCVVASHGELSQAMNNMAHRSWLAPRHPFAPTLSAISSVAVWEMVRLLSGCDRPRTLDGALHLDLFDYQFNFVPAKRREDCPVCGDQLVRNSAA